MVQEIIIIIIGIVVLAVLAWKIYRVLTKPTGMGGSCEGCSFTNDCNKNKPQ